ncbi:alkaline phosphatase family protein [Woodsholea maritima]|uniref:alkaline phosphatase family protein n=1 Tax=Woodsholea maritima TaxID=240237 RepID=UPI00036E3612|nr:alkaline phosphatase family protein [Woodsholea maritima]
MSTLLLTAALGLSSALTPVNTPSEDAKVILISVDGVRWEEVFRGPDPELTANEDFTDRAEQLNADFLSQDDPARALMPFSHDVIAQQGVLIGNRDAGSCGQLSNTMIFSYPGYNEILTGKADPRINSNAKIPNANVTILEWLNQQPEHAGKVYAFGSWDVFPFIINEVRSGVPVNAGFEALEPVYNDTVALLNTLQEQIPSPWGGVRLDAFTHHFAMETLKAEHPDMVYIAYGEPDDFAHGGDFDHYINSIHRFDAYLQELWTFAQNDPEYAGKTTLIITTDHGRGHLEPTSWRSHGDSHPGAEAVWFAALGPQIQAQGGDAYTPEHCAYTNQVAVTALKALGYTKDDYNPEAGEALDIFKGE